MAELSSLRTNNATKIGQTDDWDVELEQDIADIFGIAINHPIITPIFAVQSTTDEAVASSGGGQVNSDGSISGVIRLLTTTATAVGAAGIEFQSTGGDRYKICAVSTNLELYVWNSTDEQWDFIRSLNLGFNTFLELTDVLPDVDPPEDKTYVGHAGEFVVVNATETGVEFAAIAPVATVDFLQDIGDVPPYPMTSVDHFLKLKPDYTLEWVTSDPGTGAQNFYELDDVADNFLTNEAHKQGMPEVAQEPGGSNDWYIRPVPPVFAYGIGSGCSSDPNLTYLPASDNNWRVTQSFRYMYFESGTGNSWNERADLVFTDYMGSSDLCNLRVPGKMPGLWMWQLAIGWLNIMNHNLVFTVVENTSAGGVPFTVFQQDFYMYPPVFNRTVGEPLGLQFYDFPDSYIVTTLKFWTYHSGGTTDGKFRLKIKAGMNGSAPLDINPNHKYNLLGVRVR